MIDTAAEDATVASAVRTDTILSIEIIALTIASVTTESLSTQFGVLIAIALIATFSVYGIVGMIIKMDDVGFYLKDKENSFYQKIGNLLISGMPKVLKALGWIGMVAMLMVGGGIIMHNIDLLHFLSNIGLNLPYILPMVMTFFVSPVLLAVIIGSLIIFSINLFKKS